MGPDDADVATVLISLAKVVHSPLLAKRFTRTITPDLDGCGISGETAPRRCEWRIGAPTEGLADPGNTVWRIGCLGGGCAVGCSFFVLSAVCW